METILIPNAALRTPQACSGDGLRKSILQCLADGCVILVGLHILVSQVQIDHEPRKYPKRTW
jgi:hypothetical protein